MGKISRFAADHPAVIGILLISLVFFGSISMRSINTSLMPSLSMPEIVILSIYPGADAQTIEHEVTKVIEDDMATLPSLKEIVSQSGQSVSLVTVRFQDGTKAEDKIEEVRYRLGRLGSELPDGLDGDPMAVIATASMVECFSFSASNADASKTYEYLTDKIVPQITRIPGVTSVEVAPNAERSVNVVLRLDDLAAKNISAIDVYRVLSAGNVSLPLGETSYGGRGVALKYEGSYNDSDDIRMLAVGATEDGVIVRLADVADVIVGTDERMDNVIVDGEPAFIVKVQKRDDGDVMKICSAMKKILSEIETQTGGAVRTRIISDDSKVTRTTINAVLSSGVLGIAMAVFSIWLCLADIKATIIIAVSIPLCLLFCVIGLAVLGRSLNVMTLSGMVVSLGMVVDGSIVMLEQTYKYLSGRNFTVRQSICRAADEVAGSIFGSVATTVVVFIPIMLLPGIVGLILSDVALTLVLCMLSSFIVSLVTVPFFIRMLKKDGDEIREHRIVNAVFAGAEKGYKSALRWMLDNRKYVISLSLAALALSAMLSVFLGFTFLPSVDQANFHIDFEFPLAYSEEMTRAESKRISGYIEGLEGLDNYTMSITEGASYTSAEGRNLVSCHVNLVPASARRKRIQSMLPDIQSDLNALFPDAKVSLKNGGFDTLLAYAAGGSGYGVTLVGEDMDRLYSEALRVQEALDAHPDVMGTRLSTTYDSRSVSFGMSHQDMSDLGVTSMEAGLTVALLFRKSDAGRFRNPDEDVRYKIGISGDVKDTKVSAQMLDKIRVRSQLGEMVPFGRIGSLDEEKSLTYINRKNRARSISVESDLITNDMSSVSSYTVNYLRKNPLAEGIERDRTGMMGLIVDSIPPIAIALLVAIFLVYVVMVIQFERFSQPLIIMMCIPFTLIGVVAGLLIFGSPLSIMPILAIVALSGTVVNNGIILIDCANMERDRRRECRAKGLSDSVLAESDCSITGKEFHDTLLDRDWELDLLRTQTIEACASRIKPIFMTVATTVLGVVPMAVGRGEGNELYAPLGQAMFLGLLASAFVSLAVIPALYYSLERRKIRALPKTSES